VTDEGTSALGPTPELIARRLRELRETTGQHDEQLGQHGEQLASIGEQLREHVKQLQLAGTRHADLSAAVSEDLALKVEGLRQFVKDVDAAARRSRVDGNSACGSAASRFTSQSPCPCEDATRA
jgi:hypothetical protein